MQVLTRDQILCARDLEVQVVPVPEWGGNVNVSVMGGAQREALMETLKTPRAASSFQAEMLAATLVDESGAPLFSTDDVEPLRRKNQDVLQRLVDVAMKINGLGRAAVEEEVKNSEAVQN